jgi:predicted O-methyltransferase YrrM
MTPAQQSILAQLHGATWCQPEKRAATIRLIEEMRPRLIVELGTFGGGWLLPAAITAGPECRCYAVDPYSAGACLEGMTTPVSVEWWGNQRMLEDVRHSFWGAVKALGLTNVDLYGVTSEQAAGRFEDESIDILHSDANHSLIPTMRDALLWLPKVKIGGVFIQDDVRWHETKNGVATYTVKPTVDFLLSNGCEQMFEVAESVFLRRVR